MGKEKQTLNTTAVKKIRKKKNSHGLSFEQVNLFLLFHLPHRLSQRKLKEKLFKSAKQMFTMNQCTLLHQCYPNLAALARLTL